MECITVQKDSNLLTVDYPVVVCNNQCMVESGSSRLCSRNGLAGISGNLLVVLLLLSFACHLAQWKQDATFYSEITKLKEELRKINAELVNSKENINSIKAENNVLKKKLSDAEAELARFKSELTHVKTNPKFFEGELKNGASENEDHQKNAFQTRPTKTGAKSRHGRQASYGGCVSIPHFYLKGKGKEDIQENRFLWDGTDGISDSSSGPFEPVKDSIRDRSAVAGVRIRNTGVYYIYLQIKVHGRRFLSSHPGVGVSLRDSTQTLSQAILTQDERGLRYGGSTNDRPVDTLTLSGIFYLEREDVLYVTPLADQINDHNIQYVNEPDAAHFGGFMLQRAGCHA